MQICTKNIIELLDMRWKRKNFELKSVHFGQIFWRISLYSLIERKNGLGKIQHKCSVHCTLYKKLHYSLSFILIYASWFGLFNFFLFFSFSRSFSHFSPFASFTFLFIWKAHMSTNKRTHAHTFQWILFSLQMHTTCIDE